jgi:hypothetical protein
MKFHYDQNDKGGEVVAIIHKTDSLVVKTNKGYMVWGIDGEKFEVSDHNHDIWYNWINGSRDSLVKKKFYEGDSITITF